MSSSSTSSATTQHSQVGLQQDGLNQDAGRRECWADSQTLSEVMPAGCSGSTWHGFVLSSCLWLCHLYCATEQGLSCAVLCALCVVLCRADYAVLVCLVLQATVVSTSLRQLVSMVCWATWMPIQVRALSAGRAAAVTTHWLAASHACWRCSVPAPAQCACVLITCPCACAKQLLHCRRQRSYSLTTFSCARLAPCLQVMLRLVGTLISSCPTPVRRHC